MMRLTWFIVLFFCLGPFMLAPVSARVDEEELVRRVRFAQEAVNSAEQYLQEMQAKHQPLIDDYQAAEAEVARLAAAWQANRETLWDDANKEKELPKSLEARKEALLEHYSRMQLLHLKDKSSANKTKLLLSKRKYEEVQRQIRDFNAGNALAKRRFAAAEARSDQLWDQYVKARDRLPVQRQDAQFGEDMIAAARDELSSARDGLQKAKSEARWRLNENAPPYLEKVVVKRGSETFYEAEWAASEEDEEELLRLAQYLHEDLGRTIRLRSASTQDLGDQVLADRRHATAVLKVYTDMMGGSYSGGFMGGVEGLLDKAGLGALVTFGSHPWKKSYMEIVDANVTITRDVAGGAPPWVALAKEAAFQVGDVLYRAVKGISKNPSWDIGAMPHAGPAHVSNQLNSKNFQAIMEGLNKGRIRESLEVMRAQMKALLKGEDFRQLLARRYQDETLAIALTQATVTHNMPRLQSLKQRNVISGSGSLIDWTFNFFTQPTGAAKTIWKNAFYAAVDFRGDSPRSVKGLARGLGKDIFWDAVQAAARDGAIEVLEVKRLQAWHDWVEADADALLSQAVFQNESRLRRIDERIQKILAEQLIPELTAEVERLRASRELDIVKDAEVKDEQATLVMTFSNEVDIERVTLADVELAPKQKRDTWEARIDLEKFEDADAAQLTVVARPPAFDDRQLDDPKTVASWSTKTSSFNAYEQKPDTYHKIRLKPEEIAGEIAYYPSCIMALLDDERHLISAENERHWIAEMEKISRGEDSEDSMAGYTESIPQLLFGGFRKIREKTVWTTFALRLSMLPSQNSELEVLLGKRKRYFYTFPVVSVGFMPDKNKNRLFCIPGQPCYLEKDGGLYSKDNEWLKLAAETHKKAITEFRKDFADEMTRRESDPNSLAPNSPAADRAVAGFFHVGVTMMAGDGTCEWWAPKLPAWGTTDGLF